MHQKIRAGNLEIPIDTIFGGEHIPQSAPDKRVPMIKLTFPGLPTVEQLDALKTNAWEIIDVSGEVLGVHTGYTDQLPVEVTFLKVDDQAAQIEQLQQQAMALNSNITALETEKAEIAQQAEQAQGLVTALGQTLRAVADDLTDESAVKYPNLYPAWEAGVALTAGMRVLHEDVLYRVVQDHTTQADWLPPTTLSLYSRINPPGAIPDWVEGNWDLGVKVRHNGKVWESMVANNVWEPGAPGVYDNIWREVAA